VAADVVGRAGAVHDVLGGSSPMHLEPTHWPCPQEPVCEFDRKGKLDEHASDPTETGAGAKQADNAMITIIIVIDHRKSSW